MKATRLSDMVAAEGACVSLEPPSLTFRAKQPGIVQWTIKEGPITTNNRPG